MSVTPDTLPGGRRQAGIAFPCRADAERGSAGEATRGPSGESTRPFFLTDSLSVVGGGRLLTRGGGRGNRGARRTGPAGHLGEHLVAVVLGELSLGVADGGGGGELAAGEQGRAEG